MPHSGVGILFSVANGDSDIFDVSAGVVEVAASCSGGGLRLGGLGFTSQWGHSFFGLEGFSTSELLIIRTLYFDSLCRICRNKRVLQF